MCFVLFFAFFLELVIIFCFYQLDQGGEHDQHPWKLSWASQSLAPQYSDFCYRKLVCLFLIFIETESHNMYCSMSGFFSLKLCLWDSFFACSSSSSSSRFICSIIFYNWFVCVQGTDFRLGPLWTEQFEDCVLEWTGICLSESTYLGLEWQH